MYERDRHTDRGTDTAWRLIRPRLHIIARQKVTKLQRYLVDINSATVVVNDDGDDATTTPLYQLSATVLLYVFYFER